MYLGEGFLSVLSIVFVFLIFFVIFGIGVEFVVFVYLLSSFGYWYVFYFYDCGIVVVVLC